MSERLRLIVEGVGALVTAIGLGLYEPWIGVVAGGLILIAAANLYASPEEDDEDAGID